jgi:hypothetical protein
MNSPFPGLDPYLEPFWSGVHTRMMTYIADAIQPQLPPGLWTRVEEVVAVDGPDAGGPRRVRPDVHVSDEAPWSPQWKGEVGEGAVAVAEPLVIPVEDPVTLRHLEIVDTRSGGTVVTVIEVLSPANKLGRARRDHYLRKQADCLAAGVNLVEIDLFRSGDYIVSLPQDRLPARARCGGGLVSVYRASIAWPEWESYPIDLRRPLPAFCIPLRRGDADGILNLQEILDRCYQNGGYHLGIRYADPPQPDVSAEDREWLDQLLRDKGFRA